MNVFQKSRSNPGHSPSFHSSPRSIIPAPSPSALQHNYPPSPVSRGCPPSVPSPPCKGAARFPVGTPPEVVRCFEAVDTNRNGVIDEWELQRALASRYHGFSIRTVRFLMFLFKSSVGDSGVGPSEFSALLNCLAEWQIAFEKHDKDRSGMIDSDELQNVFNDLGYAVPPSVILMIIYLCNGGNSSKGALKFDQFVESVMIVKVLTEKFKQNDMHLTGSATLTYDAFLSMVIPLIVP